jgi:hypothetical protein
METSQNPTSQPSGPTPKKGLGTGAMIGIGCAGIVVLVIIGFIIVGVVLGPKMKKFAEDAQKNPTRATASMMVTTGAVEMVAEDDANKRYTVKDKKTGTLTTIYWNAKKNAPEVVAGDFSAIPAEPAISTPDPASGAVPEADKK